MPYLFRLITAVLLYGAFAPAAAAQVDTLDVHLDTTFVQNGERVYQFTPLTVTGRRLAWSAHETPVGHDDLQHALEASGVHLVRRGVFMASDVYVDGFKRGDVEVTIDGERYPHACPNRMDPPTTRVNPLEVEAVVVDRSSAGLQAGLGGGVVYRRARPSGPWRVHGGVSGVQAGTRSYDAALAVEHGGHRVSMQIVRGEPYEDADGAGFADLYGYRAVDLGYGRAEAAVHGERGAWRYGASYSATEDVPFPYLRMDERFDRMWSAHVGYRGHKLYVNRTHHLMDNASRTSSERMFMESDATNVTVGLTGRSYEAYYRRWELWNRFAPRGEASWEPYRQHMLPEVHVASGALARAVDVELPRETGLRLGLRAGLTHLRIGDDERLAFYRQVHADADGIRWFVPLSATVEVTRPLTRAVTTGLLAEVASEAPAAQHLYIGVRRPMGRPSWVGNPTLRAARKATVRGVLGTERFHTEAYATRVADYVHVVRRAVASQPVVTHTGVDAFMAGFRARAEARHVTLRAAYTWAQNLTDDAPLAEVAPLTFDGTITSAWYGGFRAHLSAHVAAAQPRVDAALGEARTPAWYRVDTGLTWALPHVTLRAEVTNVTDRRYHRHLSYLRDPFAAGVHVYEPGRTVRLSVRFDNL